MAEKIKAETRLSNFQYDGWFSEPLFEPMRMYACISSVYAALKPMKIETSDVKYQGGVNTPNDALVVFQMTKSHYALNIALAGMTFKADFVDWSQAPIITNIIDGTSAALTENLKTEILRHQLQILLHVVPAVPLKELTRSLLPFISRPAADVEFSGFIMHTTNGLFMVDKSLAHDDGIFIKVVCKFTGKANMEHMAKVLFEEESWLAATLGIEIV
jgi:hypothetical protein